MRSKIALVMSTVFIVSAARARLRIKVRVSSVETKNLRVRKQQRERGRGRERAGKRDERTEYPIAVVEKLPTTGEK